MFFGNTFDVRHCSQTFQPNSAIPFLLIGTVDVWRDNKFNAGYSAQTFLNPNFVMPSMLIGTVDFYRLIPFSVTSGARLDVWSAASISVWQHVHLSEQIRPCYTLACCWAVKQATNQPTITSSAGLWPSCIWQADTLTVHTCSTLGLLEIISEELFVGC